MRKLKLRDRRHFACGKWWRQSWDGDRLAGEPGLPTPSSHSSSCKETLKAKEESPSCHGKWPGGMRPPNQATLLPDGWSTGKMMDKCPQESALGSLQSESPVWVNSGVWVGLGHPGVAVTGKPGYLCPCGARSVRRGRTEQGRARTDDDDPALPSPLPAQASVSRVRPCAPKPSATFPIKIPTPSPLLPK